MINLGIFASGNGTNAENIIKYFNCPDSNIKVKLIVANNPNAYVIERAKRLNIMNITLNKEALGHTNFTKIIKNDKNFIPDIKIIRLLDDNNIDYIILAGYLLKIPDILISKYRDKIINIHPALLPKYGGKGMYGANVHKAVIAAREKESGITIHLVNEAYDSGKILFQAKCDISPTDTPDDLAAKIHLLEQANFPKVIEEYIKTRG